MGREELPPHDTRQGSETARRLQKNSTASSPIPPPSATDSPRGYKSPLITLRADF
ncbi:hypothetical protein DY000_02061249 [Brassica cretica]|uniref:Uncharacterized protein n=1 Tax=Brassica cretica TaxID=69181 RepID=A0ABQ7AT72_BRACR|nr:hypothetical protein DY000_02061249 [Brassica cretica]